MIILYFLTKQMKVNNSTVLVGLVVVFGHDDLTDESLFEVDFRISTSLADLPHLRQDRFLKQKLEIRADNRK